MEMTPLQREISEIEGLSCFGCAPAAANPDGLNLVFHPSEEGVATEFILPQKFESYPGFLHGGIVSAVLDETMGYAGVFKFKGLPFTRVLEVRYRTGVKAGEHYTCEASIVTNTENSYIARAAIRDSRGRAIVSARGEFTIPKGKLSEKMLKGEANESLRRYLQPG